MSRQPAQYNLVWFEYLRLAGGGTGPRLPVHVAGLRLQRARWNEMCIQVVEKVSIQHKEDSEWLSKQASAIAPAALTLHGLTI